MKAIFASYERDEFEKLPTGGRDIRHEGGSDPVYLTERFLGQRELRAS